MPYSVIQCVRIEFIRSNQINYANDIGGFASTTLPHAKSIHVIYKADAAICISWLLGPH